MQDGFCTENKPELTQERASLASRAFGNAYVLLPLTMLFWAGNAVVGRGAAGLVPPLTLAWLRWTIAFILILPLAWPYLKRDLPIIRAHWLVLAMLGGVGAGTFVSLFYFGLAKTTAINGVIINSAVSILVPVAVFLIYRETVTWLQSLGIVISFAGVLLVLTKGDLSLLLTLQLNEGDLWVIVATVVWAVYTALLREQPRVHWLSFAAISFGVASLINFPLFIGEMAYGKHIQPTLAAFLMIAYVSTFPSIVSQIFYVRSVELIGSNRASIFMHLVPIFGAILAILFLGEHLHLYHFAGLLLVAGGVWMASRPKGQGAVTTKGRFILK
jgi:drug/metabolite transporter (DMT)-like permease